jgi:medium-chain acyl-[acyl-carrier-protein] hydrolase
MSLSSTSIWLARPRPHPQAGVRLFCSPHAGGGTIGYRRWPALLPADVEVCLVQLPGREVRYREPAYTSMAALVGALADNLTPYLDRPFALYGHSMGALVSFELARMLRRRKVREPAHLIVSGRGAPQLPPLGPPLYQLSDAGLRDELRRLNGTPAEVLDNAELMQVLLPVLRADCTVIDTYVYTPDAPLSCPISAFGGLDDQHSSPGRLEAWREQTSSTFEMHMFPGDHFFLGTAQPQVLETLSRKLVPLHHP